MPNTQLTATQRNAAAEKDADKKLIHHWRSRRQSEASRLRYQHTVSEDEKKISVIAKVNPSLTQMQRYELQAATMCAATGTSSAEYGQMLFDDVLNILTASKNYDVDFIANAINDALISLRPQDETEGMLCMRLITLHTSYMNFMRRASSLDAEIVTIDTNINRATKLMRLYNETLEALSRYRRKGEQKVTVQHINVTNHGQAILSNNIESGGGGNEKHRE